MEAGIVIVQRANMDIVCSMGRAGNCMAYAHTGSVDRSSRCHIHVDFEICIM